ncbi:MAG TPA: hypothetical protein DCM27_03155 [Rhodospirillaceae bacterium]|nr:hypothetical protein [Rhodospirillaceae bacterium]
MSNTKDQFAGKNNPIDLSLPSAVQLSRKFRTTVFTLYPEDMPGFTPEGNIEDLHLEERIKWIDKALEEKFLFWEAQKDRDTSHGIATGRSASLTTFASRTPYEETCRIAGFVILEPSKLISPEQAMANITRLNVSSIISPLTGEEVRFLDHHHEERHIIQALRDKHPDFDFQSEFVAEWSADVHALYQYIQLQERASEQDRVINAVIAKRAVAGFLSQHEKYWIAPCLKETFDRPASRQGDLKADIDPHDIWLSYEELRLRTIAFLIGDATLNNYSSQHWKNAILLKDQCQLKEIRNMPLRFELEKQEERFRSQWFDQHRKSGAALRALSYITEYANLSSFTRSCGQQIIEGARLICPSLLQDPIRKMDTHPTRDPA